MTLVADRVGPGLEERQDIFGPEEALAVWLVGYDGDRAVCCGGLRRVDDSTTEIKRMFVTAAARGNGHGQALLHALEDAAAEAGAARIVLLTTEALTEARNLYAAAGYTVYARPQEGARQDFWMEKRLSS